MEHDAGSDEEVAGAMRLGRAAPGRLLELVRLQSGLGLAQRLAALGLVPGARFTLESGGRRGPVLISFQGTRLILGHGMAERIMVRLAGKDAP